MLTYRHFALLTFSTIAALGQVFTLETSPADVTVTVGSTVPIVTTVESAGGVALWQTASPGLTVGPSAPASLSGGRAVRLVEQMVSAHATGEYTLTTTAAIGGGRTFSATVRVRVVTEAPGPPLFWPAAVKPNTSTDVLVTVRSSTGPVTLSSHGVLTDDGRNGDLMAGDGVYSARISVDSTGLAVGQSLQFRASTMLGSSTGSVCATNLPVMPANPRVARGTIAVRFKPDAAERDIEAAAATVGGTIVAGCRLSTCMRCRSTTRPGPSPHSDAIRRSSARSPTAAAT